VVTGPGDEWVAASRSRMRAADADREQLIDALKTAFAQGRLTKDEFDLRVSQAFASRTYADLAEVVAGIPARPTGPVAPPQQQRPQPPARPSTKKVAISCACAVLGAELVLFMLIITVPLFLTLDLAVLANLVGLPLVGGLVLDTWRENHGRGQLPSGPPDARLTVSAFDCVSSGRWRP
jgi:hypothetical protein